MICQSLFPGEKLRQNIVCLLSADLAQRIIKCTKKKKKTTTKNTIIHILCLTFFFSDISIDLVPISND